MLYQECRPKTLEQVYGNTITIKTLKGFVKNTANRPHTYLFYGHYGCGKTTIARILAKEFGCVGIDYMEVNAVNTRDLNTIRTIIDMAYISPMTGKCRVFVIDECHQLLKASSDALLKVIEDVPENAYFIFCSTEPRRIVNTIRSRCSAFEVELLGEEDMGGLLEDTIDKLLCGGELEKNITDKVFDKLIYCAEGCPRDALQMLEQILEITDEEDQLKLLKKAQIDYEVKELCRALLDDKSWYEIAQIYKGLKGTDPESLRRAVLGYMRTVLLNGGKLRAYEIICACEKHTFDSGEAGFIAQLFVCCDE